MGELSPTATKVLEAVQYYTHAYVEDLIARTKQPPGATELEPEVAKIFNKAAPARWGSRRARVDVIPTSRRYRVALYISKPFPFAFDFELDFEYLVY